MSAAGRIGLAVLACGLAAVAARAEAPRRVVSLNLCADQLLLALADRDQIASVSYLARDRSLSFLAEAALAVPSNQGSGEVILIGGADLVLTGPYDGPVKRELLDARGIAVMVLPPWGNLAEGRAQITALAARLGHPERGASLLAAMDAALAHAGNAAPTQRSMLILERRGWVPGPDSFLGELLPPVGLRSAQADLGVPNGGVVRLERLVAAPPDYALVNEAETGAIDNGTAFFLHPALAAAIPAERRLRLDGKLTICGGPSTPAAIDALAAEVRAKVR